MSDSGIEARRTPAGFVVSITFDDAEALLDASELLSARLIGSTPSVYSRLESALWSAEDRPVHIVPSITSPQQFADAHAPEIPAVDAEMEEALARYEDWEDSAEGRAVRDHAERFAAYRDTQRERRRIAYTAWLESYGQEFDAARSRWQQQWNARIREEFDALDE